MLNVTQEVYDAVNGFYVAASTDADNYAQWGAAAVARRNQWKTVLDGMQVGATPTPTPPVPNSGE